MNHYLVWVAGQKPETGAIVHTHGSFQARLICAAEWGCKVTDLCARAVIA